MTTPTEALSLARELLTEDRAALIECHAWPAGSGAIPARDRDATAALARYDAAVEAIDALAQQPSAPSAEPAMPPKATSPITLEILESLRKKAWKMIDMGKGWHVQVNANTLIDLCAYVEAGAAPLMANGLTEAETRATASVAGLTPQETAATASVAGLVQPNNDEVICPACEHQFRAIPVNVQLLLLDSGHEPPFKASSVPTVQPLMEAQIEALQGLDTPNRVRFYEHDFYVLSNFSAFRLEWEGEIFDTSEAAYHAEKFWGYGPVHANWDLIRTIREAPSAHEAFKIAERNKALRRPDWDAVKVGIMKRILRAKADQHEYVRRKLLATGGRELVEDSWRDDFWGWGPDRKGRNMLGRLWMEVRAELAGIPAAAQPKE